MAESKPVSGMSLIFYDDSPVFGGHEVMALSGLEAVLSNSSDRVVFIASRSNSKLLGKLDEIRNRYQHLTIQVVDWQSSKLEGLRHWVMPWRSRKLAQLMAACESSMLVVVQGNIEHSSLGFFAAKRLGIRCVSYIPVPHTNAQMGAKFGAVRDIFCKRLWRMPDAWVTITDEMARMLRQRGAKAPIRIVYNGVDTARFCQGDKKSSREQLKLPQDRVLLGVIGRIEFRQKQQHLLIEAVAGDVELSRQCHLVFAGDGPDASRLRDMLEDGRVSGTMISWCDPAPLYRALDVVLIPSRYEGLPLVMLEALATGTAVMGSDRDGMRDLLDSEYRFDAESVEGLRQCLKNWLRLGMPAAAEELKNRVRSEMSLAAFAATFSRGIEDEKANSFFSKSG